MRSIAIIAFLALAIITMVAGASASLVIFEAGNYTICIDKNMEISAGFWPILAGFTKQSSRDAYENDIYEFQFTSVFSTNDVGLIPQPTILTIQKTPYDVTHDLTFTPRTDGDAIVGEIKKVKTTLYTGDFTFMGKTSTPYFVNFSIDSQTQCMIYVPNTSKDTFTKLLSSIDIIPKKDLSAALQTLWP